MVLDIINNVMIIFNGLIMSANMAAKTLKILQKFTNINLNLSLLYQLKYKKYWYKP